MKIVIIGEGGREHALVWKVAQSNLVTEIFALPGNVGTSLEPKTQNVPIQVSAIADIVQFCEERSIDLCIIGPEVPLVLGLSDELDAKGIKCFGPSQAASQLEGSKAFSKAFLERHSIPTAAYANFSDLTKAKAYVENQSLPIVIKADGLAAGKGVIIAQTQEAAFTALDDILINNQFGEAGANVVVEAFLEGEEASFMCIADGESVVPLATSQDHKAAYDGDLGPNTGGMGAYSPAPIVDDEMHKRIMQAIIEPTLEGLKAEGMPYVGFLYAGVMINEQGEPWVLEFNCRMGDPETQPIMMRMKSDLVAHCLAAVNGDISGEQLQWREETALGVILASEGYPGAYEGNQTIQIDADDNPDVKLFYAGVKKQGNETKTSGGRVMCACALGETVQEAQANAYQLVDKVSWNGMWHRNDIGHRAIAREIGRVT
ncbi:MAG: phosphoribosylamine--glycine ligase [Saprospiraceae bacterium]|jgi:phosphoribosylamine--glycine ligase